MYQITVSLLLVFSISEGNFSYMVLFTISSFPSLCSYNWLLFSLYAECNPGFYMYQQGCVRECPAGFTSVSYSKISSYNEVAPGLHPACMPCHELCLTCSGTGPQDCLSCPPHSHLNTGTCQHQNQIQRESPDADLFPSRGRASSGILNLQLSSSLPATVAVLCCAFIAATFVVVFGLLQFRSYSLTKVYSSEASVGSVMRASFGLGMAHNSIISYKGIPTVWNEDGGNSESENDEFDIHNERTAFIKTQSAL